jgi:hypothetical protein
MLLSVDEGGTPRVALLSRSEVHVARHDLVLLALWPDSRSAANIERSGGATLFWLVGVKAVSVSLRRIYSEPLTGASTGAPAGRAPRAFTLYVVDVRADEVDYAELVTPMTFALRDPDAVLPRWEQVARRLAAIGRRLWDGADSAGSD